MTTENDNANTSKITFVTAYMNIYTTPFQNKDAEWRFRHFRKIAETGIQLSVICSPDCSQAIETFALEFPNIKIIKYMNLCDTWTHSVCSEVENKIGEPLQLPNSRNIEKDTREYILLMNAKTEFLKIAIEEQCLEFHTFCLDRF
jgi:IMP cyclohydrolase